MNFSNIQLPQGLRIFGFPRPVHVDAKAVPPEPGYPSRPNDDGSGGYLNVKLDQFQEYLDRKRVLGDGRDAERNRNLNQLVVLFEQTARDRYQPNLSNFYSIEEMLKKDWEARDEVLARLNEHGIQEELPPIANLDSDEAWAAIKANVHRKNEEDAIHEGTITPKEMKVVKVAKLIGMLPITLLLMTVFGFDPFQPFGFLIAAFVASGLGLFVDKVLTETLTTFTDGFLWKTPFSRWLESRLHGSDVESGRQSYAMQKAATVHWIVSAVILGLLLYVLASAIPNWLELDAQFLMKKGLSEIQAHALTQILLGLSLGSMLVVAVVNNRIKRVVNRSDQLIDRLRAELAPALSRHRTNLIEDDELERIWNQKNWVLGRVSETLQLAAGTGDLADPDYVQDLQSAMLEDLGPRRKRWSMGGCT